MTIKFPRNLPYIASQSVQYPVDISDRLPLPLQLLFSLFLFCQWELNKRDLDSVPAQTTLEHNKTASMKSSTALELHQL